MSNSKLSGPRPRALAVAVALCCIAPAAMAAGRQDLQNANLAQLQARYSGFVAANGTPDMAHARHERLLNMDSESNLLLTKRHSDFGKRNTRYEQTFRGIPVYGENIIVSENARTGRVEALFGRMVTGLEKEIPATAIRVTDAQALAIAQRAALGSALPNAHKSRLMIYVGDDGRAHRAHVVQLSGVRNGAPTAPLVIVDADSGKVLMKRENFQTDAIGTGPGGNQKTGQYEYGTDFGFMDVGVSGSTCTMLTTKVKTVDLNHASRNPTPADPAFSYTCPRHTGDTINGGYSPLNDAHYFGGIVFDMYSAYMNAAPLTVILTLGVHYGTNYENAGWNPTTSTMIFGDGKNTFYPLVGLDVLGHEVSHGYTTQNSNLNYDSGQSGGMNESFSDIAGEAAEYFMTGTNDFLVGEEIFKGTGALRYMCNPTQDGISIDNAADMPRRGMDNHYSSGVQNKAFCNLAKTPGWTTKTAFQAFARANRDYWTPTTQWNDGACGVQRAAADMGMNVSQVAAAFATVGVTATGTNCGGGGGNNPPEASFTVKTRGQFVQVTSTSTDSDGTIASVKWDSGDGRTSTKTPLTYKYASPGTYTVTLTVTDDDGATSSTSKSVTVP
ncbi:MAG: M4 family metallopeptidase [Thermomonas sp.]